MSVDLLNALLETRALQLAPAGEMFWYTSGTIGPYYINTHFLYGGQGPADELLTFIDAGKGNRSVLARQLTERVLGRYRDDGVYASVVDALVEHARTGIGADDIDLVSGGERRDWFFSAAVAHAMNKPHLMISKDAELYLQDGDDGRPVTDLQGARALHVADLVTEASSYFRAWIPAIACAGGKLLQSVNVVDRGQGGIQALREMGVPSSALLRVDESLFGQLLATGRIDRAQAAFLSAYYRDPHAAMSDFLLSHGEFLRAALQSPQNSTAARARMLVEQNPYDLDMEALTA